VAAKALVTGASGGLGLEFATRLAQAGYDLVLVARSQSKIEEAAAHLQSTFGIRAQAVAMDLAQSGSAARLAAAVPDCDVLVNNAGFANNGKFFELDAGDILEEVQLDVVTLTELCRAYLPKMLARGDGKIMNVASTAAFLPGPNMAVYYASKAYVLSFSEALAEEVKGTGVTVTAFCPGATATGFHERARMQSTPLFRVPAANAARVAKAGVDGMMRGKRVVVPGLANKLVALFLKFTPRRLLLTISAKAVERR
jgi:short-subunit dehydrogenase